MEGFWAGIFFGFFIAVLGIGYMIDGFDNRDWDED